MFRGGLTEPWNRRPPARLLTTDKASTNMSQILIAEDNSVTLDLLRFNLERAGFTVTTARNGTLAFEAASVQTFDLILTDYQMPGMDGEQFCRRLRELPQHTQTPVILCSAKGYEFDKDQLRKDCGVAAFVNKPFSPRQMVETVRNILADESANCFTTG